MAKKQKSTVPASAERKLKLEDVRARMQSAEAVISSSVRDARLLVSALVDDVLALYSPAMPSEAEKKRLDDAKTWAQATGDGSDKDIERGLMLMRAIVADVAPAADGHGDAGVPLWQRRLKRFSGIELGSAVAGLVILLSVGFVQARTSDKAKVAEFQAAFNQASAKQNAGDHAAAIPLFEKAVSILPDQDRSANAWNDLGWSLQNTERYEEAVTAYKRALLIRPTFDRARNNMETAIRKAELKKKNAP